MKEKNLLEVKDLRVSFFTPVGEVKAVDGISYSPWLQRGDGNCRRVRFRPRAWRPYSIIGLLQPAGRVIGGSIHFEGENILAYDKKQMQAFRGNEVSMIFQNPMTCLNPVYTIGNQLMEAYLTKEKQATKKEARERSIEMLELVGINNAAGRDETVSTRIFRRHEAAGDDRYGPYLRSETSDCR